MVWLWHTLQNDGDSVKLADESHVTVMLAKTLTLDCPRGEMGRDQLTDRAGQAARHRGNREANNADRE